MKKVYVKLDTASLCREHWEEMLKEFDKSWNVGLEVNSIAFTTGRGSSSMSADAFILGVYRHKGDYYLICTEGRSCLLEYIKGQTKLGALVLKPCDTQTDASYVEFECLSSTELADTVFNLWYSQAEVDAEFERVPGLLIDEDLIYLEEIPEDYFENEGRKYVATI